MVGGLAFFALLAVRGIAVGQTATLETVAFVDTSNKPPSCCAIPGEVVVRDAVKKLPGIVRVSLDEATGQVAVNFDPARVSRAEVIAAVEPYNFRPIGGRR
jgi:copper chaperone CopZ